jgi:hypothetical protein
MGLASSLPIDLNGYPVPKTKTKAKPKAKAKTTRRRAPRAGQRLPYRVRRSPVHGTGLFAVRTIAKGESIIEYVGERISQREADRRHAHKADDDNHTFLFTIDKRTVIDAGVGGNESRLINHSCDPNCEVFLVDGRPFIEALRDVAPGEELAYDYNLTRDADDEPGIEKIFACRCGAASCRGTMLAPRKGKAKAKAKAEAKPRGKAAKRPAAANKPKRTARRGARAA